MILKVIDLVNISNEINHVKTGRCAEPSKVVLQIQVVIIPKVPGSNFTRD